ncbi:GntR family transcriptional regulator [Streptomyces sp. NBC_01455]|uniref:GntR family transcriptional regulator n=1 Tax=Streptomyces sp. NBC_01455 TaxID=2903874 RepID=UPI002E32B1BF|nr:GntR family transcriptional regulator [Streptomyces sp. NBC_01455]
MATPKWRRLADEFAQRIRSGELEEGKALPQIRELTAAGAGSTTTVQAAYRALETEGLVRTVRGRGTYVRRQRRRVVRQSQARYQWEKDRALLSDEERLSTGVTERETGLQTPQLNFHVEFEVVDASADLANRFEVPANTRMLHRHYRTSSQDDTAPISLIDSWLVYSVAAQNPALLDSGREPWPGGTVHQLSTIGIELGEITDTISGRPPTARESQLLDLDPGTAVLVLRKASYSVDGVLAEYSEVILPGDRTEFLYRIPLERWAPTTPQ